MFMASFLSPLTMTARIGGNANRLSGTIFAFLQAKLPLLLTLLTYFL
jgi:hypothetical protein